MLCCVYTILHAVLRDGELVVLYCSCSTSPVVQISSRVSVQVKGGEYKDIAGIKYRKKEGQTRIRFSTLDLVLLFCCQSVKSCH